MGIFSRRKDVERRKVVKEYRVDGRDRYKIEYVEQGHGTWKLFCHNHPHNPRSTNVSKCHLYSSGEVCVAGGHEPKTLDQAMAIGIFWAQGYSNYLRTGTFYNGKARVNV